jgi:hypothetical protein
MTSRYSNRNIIINANESYDEAFKKRDVKYVEQFSTPNLEAPTMGEISTLDVITEVWQTGDRFWKYAAKYYGGRSDLWWVIAWFNKTPSEGLLTIGDLVYIPTPVDRVLEYYGY